MSIAAAKYRPWRVPEKIHEIEIALTPGLMIGQVIEVGGEPLITVGIVHAMGGFSTTRLRVVEPNWVWKFKYKGKRFLRNAWRRITRPFRWLYQRARRG